MHQTPLSSGDVPVERGGCISSVKRQMNHTEPLDRFPAVRRLSTATARLRYVANTSRFDTDTVDRDAGRLECTAPYWTRSFSSLGARRGMSLLLEPCPQLHLRSDRGLDDAGIKQNVFRRRHCH